MNHPTRAVLLALLLASPLPALAGDDTTDSALYTELDLNAYAGSGSFTQEAYLELAVGDGGVLLWANPYRESGYTSAVIGIGKTVGNWTFALGAGQARSDGTRIAVRSAWLGYETDKTELMLTAERYDNAGPAYWQGYAQRRMGRHFYGLYGETGVGIGPQATFVLNDHLRLRLAIPVADRGDTRAMVSLVLTQ